MAIRRFSVVATTLASFFNNAPRTNQLQVLTGRRRSYDRLAAEAPAVVKPSFCALHSCVRGSSLCAAVGAAGGLGVEEGRMAEAFIEEARAKLRTIFGHPDFRDGQVCGLEGRACLPSPH